MANCWPCQVFKEIGSSPGVGVGVGAGSVSQNSLEASMGTLICYRLA